jgi:hypothetical protein
MIENLCLKKALTMQAENSSLRSYLVGAAVEPPPAGAGGSLKEAVSRIRTSVAFYDELFILKEHIQIVRMKLDSLLRPSRGMTADSDPD